MMSTTTAENEAIDLDGPGFDGMSQETLVATIHNLRAQLASLPVIEQAKGALMAGGLTADEAFELLRRHSQHHNVKLRLLAAEFTRRLPQTDIGSQASARLNQLLANIARDRPCEFIAAAMMVGPDGRLAQ